MKLSEAIDSVRKYAAKSGYHGELTYRAVKACAEVILSVPTDKLFHADNGKKTNLTEILWLLSRTTAFQRWFGKSVVVDENGEPRVMYHGSPDGDIKEYKPSFISVEKSKMTLWSGPGFYFTDNKKTAIIYGKGGGAVNESFIRLVNPLVVDETGNGSGGENHITRDQIVSVMMDGDNTQLLDRTLAGELARMDAEDKSVFRGRQYYKSLSRRDRVEKFAARLKTDVVKLKSASSAFGAKSQKKLLAAIMKHTGHDGVIHHIAPGVTEWVVYEPKNIKSATDNDGEFDATSAVVEDSTELNGTMKGRYDMKFKGIFDAIGRICKDSKVEAMDIVDRHGRHHQPKAIPEGGQYEEEGQYLTGSAKIEHAISRFGTGKHGNVLREHVARMYAKMGVDSNTRAAIQKMHEDVRGKTRHQLLRGMVDQFKKMKSAAEAYDAVKDMNKEEFAAWLREHPEFNTTHIRNLMENSRYNRHYGVVGSEGNRSYHDDGTGRQKHEAWEEAKWAVGAQSVAAAIQFQEYSDAYHGTPDAIIANEINRAEVGGPDNSETEVAADVPREQITTASPRPIDEGNRTENNHSAIEHNAASGRAFRLPENFTQEQSQNWDAFVRSGPGGGEQIHGIERALNDSFGVRVNMRDITARDLDSLMLGDIEDPESRSEIERVINRYAVPNGVDNHAHITGESSASNSSGEIDFNDAARQFAEHHHITPSPAHANAMRYFLTQAQNGQIDLTHPNTGIRSNEMRYYDDIIAALGSNHPYSQSLNAAVARQRNMSSAPQESSQSTESQTPQAGSNAEGLGNASSSSASTYLDRDGNTHPIEHNEGGLKAPIHQSEIGAVQAEMRQAFADAGNGVIGAEEYAHAISHFLGRGQDERSPHPGMRQEGLLKHQLADKMQSRLEAKKSALESASEAHGRFSDEVMDAAHDLDATERAVKMIAEKCGITADMLPEGTDFNLVRSAMGVPVRAANPEHQGIVDALHSIANPEPAHAEHAGNEQEHSVASNGENPATPSHGGSTTLPDFVLTDIRNATGVTPEEAMAQAEQNESRVASDSTAKTDAINNGHIHDAFAVRYRILDIALERESQAIEARDRGDMEEYNRLHYSSMINRDAIAALSHFISRDTGGMASRNENGELTHTGETMERLMADYLGNKWERAVGQHGVEGASDSTEVRGARKAILRMGDILGFTPRFRDGHVTFEWGNGETHDPLDPPSPTAQTETTGNANTNASNNVNSAIPNATPSNTTNATPVDPGSNPPREPNEDEIGRAAERLTTAYGISRASAISRVRHFIESARLGMVSDAILQGCENLFGHDHPVTQFLRAHSNGTQTNAPAQNTEQTQTPQNPPASATTATPNANAGAGNATATAARAPFSHTGSLPQNHALRQFTFSSENMNRSNREVGGMPYNFTRASQITPQRLAKLTGDLPIRGIFDHRDGTVNVPGHGRVAGGEAIRMMLTDPSSAIGTMMRERLARWHERNGNSNSVASRAVKRMNQALDILHPMNARSSATSQGESPRRGDGTVDTAKAMDRELIRGTNLTYSDTPPSSVTVGHIGHGKNCYRCSNLGIAKERGITGGRIPGNYSPVNPNLSKGFVGRDGNQITGEMTRAQSTDWFAHQQNKLAEAYRRVTNAEDAFNLVSAKPRAIVKMWDGGHSTYLVNRNGTVHFVDMYHGYDYPIRSYTEIYGRIAHGDSYHSAEAAEREFRNYLAGQTDAGMRTGGESDEYNPHIIGKFRLRQEERKAQAEGRPFDRDKFIKDYAKYYVNSQGSYYIDPSDPLIPEILADIA